MLRCLRNIALVALVLAVAGCGSTTSEVGPSEARELTAEEEQKREDEFRNYQEEMRKHMPIPKNAQPGGYPTN